MAFFESLAAIGNLVGAGSALLGAFQSREGFRVDERLLNEAIEIARRGEIPLEEAFEIAKGAARLAGVQGALGLEQADLVRAAADPTSKRFRNLAGLYEGLNRRALITAIEDIMRQDRRGRARGDPAFAVAPERRDEARTNALLRQFMLGRERANVQGMNALLAAASGLGGAGQTVGSASRGLSTASGAATGVGRGFADIANAIISGAAGGSRARQGLARTTGQIGGALGDLPGALEDAFFNLGGSNFRLDAAGRILGGI